MKMKSIASLVAGLAAATLLSAPVYAAKVALDDEDLDAVSGMDNSAFVGGSSYSSVSATNANGNIQVGFFQWDDNHSADTSTNKGANVQSGDFSQVQQNATAMTNALAWGAVAQAVTNNAATIGGNQRVESWAVLFIGGF